MLMFFSLTAQSQLSHQVYAQGFLTILDLALNHVPASKLFFYTSKLVCYFH